MKEFLRKNITTLSFAFGLLVATSFAFGYQAITASNVDVEAELALCERFENEAQKLDCWYEIMRTVHNKEGTAAAFEVFNTLYENEPLFVRTGCHLHAHRIGDFTYYDNYVLTRDLDAIDFPDGSQICGYGFYHGFFEHLVQDNPEPEYVTELCNYFDNRLTSRMPGIRITCYHGSGHGFTLAEVDEGDMSHWGNYDSIIEKPLELCSQLSEASEGEMEECRQGVFNVLVLWMESEEHGLTYDWEDPFWLCADQEYINKNSCYYEVGQKLDGVSGHSIERTMEVLEDIPDQEFVGMLLSTAVAGFLQRTITTDTQFEYMEACVEMHTDLQHDCIGGVVAGLMEHGNPGKEHVKAIEICSVPYLNDTQRNQCFDELGGRLKKFHSDDIIYTMCMQTENEHFRNACTRYGVGV